MYFPSHSSLQILTLKNLIKRNRDKATAGESPSQNSAIGLPFILVNTNKNTTIDCSISSDKYVTCSFTIIITLCMYVK